VIANAVLTAVPLIPLYLGIYLVFLMRNDFDLTLGGTYGLGGAIAAILLIHHVHYTVAILAAAVGGGLIGLVTAFMHSKLRIPIFLAGLIMLTALYTISLRVMNKKPTISLTSSDTILSGLAGVNGDAFYFAAAGILGIVALIALVAVGAFLKTEVGLALRASGINVQMARSNGFNDKFGAALALLVSNALAALSGALVVQSQAFVAVSMSQGTVILSALAGVIIGALVARPTSSKVLRVMLAVAMGAVIYQLMIVVALELGLDPVDLNLVTALILVLAIAAQILVRRAVALTRKQVPTDFSPLRESRTNELIKSLSGES